ncbi:MAG: hypothetical protein ACTFAK_11170 [Candidatus Electronema sp. VV]
MSDTQPISELRNEIPKLPPCPVCGGEVNTYLCSLPDELEQFCFCYQVPRPSKNKWCSFCDDTKFNSFSTPDDAAKAWCLKVEGSKSLISKCRKFFHKLILIVEFLLVFSFLMISIYAFIQSLSCGCFE